MLSKVHTFQETLEAYRGHLIRNPGTALDTGSGIVALLDYTGDVYGAIFHGSFAQIDRGCAFDFDEASFHEGHWEGQTAAETAATIQTPKLIDFSLF